MKAVDQNDKLQAIERTMLELGSEVYLIKGAMVKQRQLHEQFLAIVRGLKQLLDEKGLITLEDFEGAIELGDAIERFNSQHEQSVIDEIEKIKKTGH